MSIFSMVSEVKKLKNTHGPGYYDTGKAFRDAHHEPGVTGNPRNKSTLRKIRDFSHWPNPFGKLIDINHHVCDQEQIVELVFWGAMAGSFWFQNFFPSPRELERRWLTGQYRCGFFLEASPLEAEFGEASGARSPFDLLWKNGPTVVIRGILEPALTAVYYAWAAGTAFNALAQFNTVLLQLASCDANPNLTNFALGDADFASHGGVGSPTAYNTISDPSGFGNALTGNVLLMNDNATFNAWGHFSSLGKTVHSVRVEWSGHLCSNEFVELGAMGPFEIKGWSLSGYKTGPGHGDVQVKITVDQEELPVGNSFADCVRFVVNQTADQHIGPPQDRHRTPKCWAEDSPYLPLNPAPYVTPVG